MNHVNPQLIEYFEKNIFPEYSKNEEAHGIKHIEAVIERSFQLIRENDLDVNPDMVYAIAGYHDIGHHIDSKNHEKVSADIMSQDEGLKQFFSKDELKMIQEAIEDHRASSDTDPRSIYGKIVSSADRNHSVDDCFRRTYQYGKKLDPNATDEQLFKRAYDVLLKKFGENGYAKHYFHDQNYEAFLKEIRELLKDEDKFIQKQREYIKKLNAK